MEARVHGILKDAFYLDQTFANVAHAKAQQKIELICIMREDCIYI